MKNVITALSKARSAMAAPVKRSANPAFRSKFADLQSILEAIEPALAAHDLVITQTLRRSGESQELVTTLWHASGESIESVAELRAEKQTLQGLGSAITYLRRYSIQALLNLAAEDDDGNSASGVGSAKPAATTPATRVAPAPKTPAPSAEPTAEALCVISDIENATDMDTLTAAVASLTLPNSTGAMSDSDRAHIRAAFAAKRSALAPTGRKP